jgi:uncharacterized protein YndB with AHSA1/START domain
LAVIHVSAERVIQAPASAVFALLTDYRIGHPNILPPAFSHFRVLDGGTGAGTRIQFDLTLGARTQTATGVVTEPEPGHVLVETYDRNEMATTFTIDPVGEQSRLRIETAWKASPGVRRLLERLLAPRLLHKIYDEEMTLIARRLTAASAPGTP